MLRLIIIVFISVSLHAYAQSPYPDVGINEGLFYVSPNSTFYIRLGNVNFGSSSITQTSKSSPYAANDGKIILGANASITTDGLNQKFIDGYCGTIATTAKILTTGSDLIHAPVLVTPSTNAGVYAAYFNASPLTNIGSSRSIELTQVANVEYWIIKGTDAKFTLSWRSSSNLNMLSFPDLTIVGFKNGVWEVIDSQIDTNSVFDSTSSTSSSGSISTMDFVNLSEYDAFTIGEKGLVCEVIPSSGITRNWDGNAWDTVPTINDLVVLNGAYNAGSFDCYSLNLNGNNIELEGDETLQVVDGVSGTGIIKLIDNASLVQHNPGGAKPQIEMTRTTRAMRRFDYVYWGVPVVENVFSQINGAIALGAVSPGAFDFKYRYVSGNTTSSGGWQNLTSTQPGVGFITRVKSQAPYIDGTVTAPIDMKISGTANNGAVFVPIAKVAGNETSARNNNLLSNPYPSAIDADKFLTANNTLLDGVIYLWRASSANSGAIGETYSVSDYIAYTKAGSTAYSGTSSSSFNGKIASGQGFKVRALADGTAVFNNCMRVSGTNDQFNRSSESSNAAITDRYKIRFSTNNGIINQLLIAYGSATTLGYDSMYDAQLLTVSPTILYSILDGGTQKLSINARPSFDLLDTVQLGFTKAQTMNETMYIDVVHREGVFNLNQVPIYLYDAVLNIYHDFSTGPYSFSSQSLLDNTRFKIVYDNPALSQNTFSNTNTTAFIENNIFNLSSNIGVLSIQIFDLTGRLLEDYKLDNATSFTVHCNKPKSVYVVRIQLNNGIILSKKLINN